MTIIRGLLFAFFIVFMLLAVLIFLAVDSQPNVKATAPEQMQNAETVKQLLSQISQSLNERTTEQEIIVSEDQLLSIVGFIQRATPRFKGNALVGDRSASLYASIALPTELTPLFVNLEITVLPDDKLNVSYVRVGSLSLSGDLAVLLVEKLANAWTDSDIATQAKQQITQISMTDDDVIVKLKPLDAFLNKLNEIRNGINVKQDDELRDLTAYYLRYASWQEIALSKDPQPFVDYLRATIKRAQERSTPKTAVLHNKAAILGLAIFIGHHRIANFVGDVHPDAQRALKPASPALLGGRNDLARHFIISAALKVLSEQGVSLAIGEFKELMDRAMGGSGYSFVDLMADIAGVKFANIATHPTTATRLQEIIGETFDEKMLLPSYEGLPEGLNKSQFEADYDRVDSTAYRKRVNEIERRLAELPLYQLEFSVNSQ
ncbi:hypothetical protein [Alteromonas sp. ASW11-130]|uniref:hypothetical protein n=1 Tax=Alteromonas sp. ASW11-130 TaxID=3015775 RepID=UPI002242B003|nr:hypothetical protein [Alteromonas sp. ASW11-130]MCW8090541.1 hypothetical protein [Alteromonas sp. ASW11-130]